MVNAPAPATIAVPNNSSSRREWAVAAITIAVGTLCFGLIFSEEIAAAVQVWVNSDAYTHCFLVLPVAAYLAWERREAVAANIPRPAPWMVFPALLVAAAWFMADRLGIMEGRQLMAMTLFQLMVASLLGLTTWQALSAPLLYLFFLVPFGDFIITPLQSLAVHFTTASLNLLGIPNFSDGITIEIPEGTFLVHQACSGFRFLIASAAFGALFSCLMFTSSFRRVSFIAVSLAVAIIGNCLRVVGIILIAHFVGNAEAAEAGHILWGWLFYLLLGSILVLIGLRFRQEGRLLAKEPTVRGHTLAPAVVALAAMLLLASLPAATANYLDAGSSAAEVAQIDLPSLPECSIVPLSSAPVIPPAENSIRLSNLVSGAYRCNGDTFAVTVRRYPPRIGVRPLFQSVRTAVNPPEATDVFLQTGNISIGRGAEESVWQITDFSLENGYAAVATSLWLNGRPSGTGIFARLTQSLNTVRRRAISPVLITVTYVGGSSVNGADRALREFLPQTAEFSKLISKSVLAQ
jgi:exosortase A